jgi:nicotinate dehydrogenase subunit A
MAINLCRCGTHMRILRAVRRAADTIKSAGTEHSHGQRGT